MKNLSRPFYLVLGYVSLILGIVGIFVPLLPTVPFILLAAFSFSKSNKRLHDWLYTHKRFGPQLRDWDNHNVIRLKTKLLATATVSISLLIMYLMEIPKLAFTAAAVTIALVFTYVWTRPSAPKSQQ